MNTNTELANMAAQAIARRPPCGHDRYHICFSDNKIQCLPVNHTSLDHSVIFELKKIHLEQGFEPEEWDEIVRKLLQINFREPKK